MEPPAPQRPRAGEPGGNSRRSASRRSVARLAAVQALYQLELNPGVDPEAVLREFGRHRFGHDIDGEQYREVDPALFSDIVRGVAADREYIDQVISSVLTEEWPLRRLDAVLRAILRAGAYELARHDDVPPRVSISEYTSLAHAFFSGKEPGLANGVLDRLGRNLRAAEM
ncbi:MAG: transcription antitermination factor NusB [Alphaproteobacteria bacterium]|nr:transcription antitermination factor NusB [Alphaproteobacteria bacterium]